MANNLRIRWVLPPNIIEGTLLDGKLLNAKAFDDKGNEAKGTFTYMAPKRRIIYSVNPGGDVAQDKMLAASVGELILTVEFTLADQQGNVKVEATRATYVQQKDSDNLSCKPKTDLKASWNRLLNDPSIPGAMADLFLSQTGAQVSQAQKETASDTIVSAIKGADAIKAAAEPLTGELVVEVSVENEEGREEPLTRESLRTFQLQVLDEYQSLAATRQIVEEGRIRIPNVRAGLFILGLSAELAGPDGDIDNEYQVRSGGAEDFKKVIRTPWWEETKEVPTKVDLKSGLEKTILDRLRSSNFSGYVLNGQTTTVRLKRQPPPARIRCFSALAGDDSRNCAKGMQYIAQVPISVMRGEVQLHSNATDKSGCTRFKLRPGWYAFRAPQDITIEGCQYALSSTSPISAYVDARQGCSDIHFYYFRKGTEIQVGTFVAQPTTSDPNSATVEEPLPDIQYLLLREGDDTFTQQQMDSGDGAVFSNLPPGTYWLFFQAPATYKSLPIKPVHPRGGRMAITTFAGQMRPIPVRAKYTSIDAVPAVEFNGYVRDASGNAMPQQLVKIVNSAGVAVAAALTDAQGYCSILIYEAENLQIVYGAQKQAIPASQITSELKATPVLARPTLAKKLAQAAQESLLTQRS